MSKPSTDYRRTVGTKRRQKVGALYPDIMNPEYRVVTLTQLVYFSSLRNVFVLRPCTMRAKLRPGLCSSIFGEAWRNIDVPKVRLQAQTGCFDSDCGLKGTRIHVPASLSRLQTKISLMKQEEASLRLRRWNVPSKGCQQSHDDVRRFARGFRGLIRFKKLMQVHTPFGVMAPPWFQVQG